MYDRVSHNETIWRIGKKIENILHLTQRCEEAFAVIGLYGVTAFANKPPLNILVSYATCFNLEELGFEVYITPIDSTPEHRTVVFPQPINQKLIDAWNSVWKRQHS